MSVSHDQGSLLAALLLIYFSISVVRARAPPLPRCARPLCRCSTCLCDEYASSDILHRAYSNKVVFFVGDSTSRNAAVFLAIRLVNLKKRAKTPLRSARSTRSTLCPMDCHFDPLHMETRTRSLPDVVLNHPKPAPDWKMIATLEGRKPAFRTDWEDAFVHNPQTNTTIFVLFCVTPDVLRRKLDKAMCSGYGRLPDVLIMNTGRWSTLGPRHANALNERMRSDGFHGRFSVVEYNKTQVAQAILRVMRGLNAVLDRRRRKYRPFVVYRDLTWLNETAHSWIPPGYLGTITGLNQEVHRNWMTKPPIHIRYLSVYGLSTLPCCGYLDYAHAGYTCNTMMSTWIATHLDSAG